MGDVVERLRQADKRRCPFDDKSFFMDSPNDPCPVCGMIGTVDAEDACVSSHGPLHRDAIAAIEARDSRIAKLEAENERLRMSAVIAIEGIRSVFSGDLPTPPKGADQ